MSRMHCCYEDSIWNDKSSIALLDSDDLVEV